MNTSLLKWALLSVGSLALAAPLQQADALQDSEPRFFFKIQIDGVDVGEFAEVSGLGIERAVIFDTEDSRTRGDKTDPLVRKRPGRVKYGDITLKKGTLPAASSMTGSRTPASETGPVRPFP